MFYKLDKLDILTQCKDHKNYFIGTYIKFIPRHYSTLSDQCTQAAPIRNPPMKLAAMELLFWANSFALYFQQQALSSIFCVKCLLLRRASLQFNLVKPWFWATWNKIIPPPTRNAIGLPTLNARYPVATPAAVPTTACWTLLCLL